MTINSGNFSLHAEDDASLDYPAVQNSMALRIEWELNRLLVNDNLPTLPDKADDREVRDRRRLFVAIARAVTWALTQTPPTVTIKIQAAEIAAAYDSSSDVTVTANIDLGLALN